MLFEIALTCRNICSEKSIMFIGFFNFYYFYCIQLICKLKHHCFIHSFLPIRFDRAAKAVLEQTLVIFCSSRTLALPAWNLCAAEITTGFSHSLQWAWAYLGTNEDWAEAETRSWTVVLEVGWKQGGKWSGTEGCIQHSTSEIVLILHLTYTNTVPH